MLVPSAVVFALYRAARRRSRQPGPQSAPYTRLPTRSCGPRATKSTHPRACPARPSACPRSRGRLCDEASLGLRCGPDVFVASTAKLLVEHRIDIIAKCGQSRPARLRDVLVELEFHATRICGLNSAGNCGTNENEMLIERLRSQVLGQRLLEGIYTALAALDASKSKSAASSGRDTSRTAAKCTSRSASVPSKPCAASR